MTLNVAWLARHKAHIISFSVPTPVNLQGSDKILKMCVHLNNKLRAQGFWSAGATATVLALANMVFFDVVCWGSRILAAKLKKVISSVRGCPLDMVEVVNERRMNKLHPEIPDQLFQ